MSKAKKKNIVKTEEVKPKVPSSFGSFHRYYQWIVFAFAFLIYGNTLLHNYTQDDAIVIYDNMFTQDGVSGIPGLLKYDTFYGFFKTEGKAKLVSGGRYRPLTPIMFAVEYQLFGASPGAGHLISVLLYSLLCLLIYKLLVLMLLPKMKEKKGFYLFVLFASLLFAAHPLHTEVVANIKGRDEIMSMMGAVLALYYSLKYIDSNRRVYLLWAAFAFFLGLMAKETTITYLAVIPLAVYFFRSVSFSKVVLPTVGVAVSAVLFLIIRFSVLGMDFGGAPMELMNNPYLKIEGNNYVPFSFGEKAATIIYTLGKYIQLLIFPHPLTHDYYPRHVEIMSFGNWQVILSLLTYLGMFAVAMKGLRSKNLISFCILYFLITLSIVSNVVFPIGTNMSERFMFMPSLGFVVLVAYVASKYVSSKNVLMGVMATTIFFYSMKTFTRNFVWQDDFTLFTTDVKTSSNSAKILNAAGGALVTESAKPENASKKDAMLNEAIPYLKKALTIHPNYKNAALLLGNASFYKGDYEGAIKAYERTLQIAPEYKDAIKNLAIAYRDAGKQAGEKERDLEKAKRYLKRSIQLMDNDADAFRLLGIVHGMGGEHQEAIKYFTMVTEMQPKVAIGYVNLGKAYQYYGDDETSRIMFQKGLELDPKALDY
ncbi:MAG: tetratricopeptide (TPR) repeat protein [Saprospiraceae bacterium]|jgi:tetratricopeptide (TPR) repeat protein